MKNLPEIQGSEKHLIFVKRGMESEGEKIK